MWVGVPLSVYIISPVGSTGRFDDRLGQSTSNCAIVQVFSSQFELLCPSKRVNHSLEYCLRFKNNEISDPKPNQTIYHYRL